MRQPNTSLQSNSNSKNKHPQFLRSQTLKKYDSFCSDNYTMLLTAYITE